MEVQMNNQGQYQLENKSNDPARTELHSTRISYDPDHLYFQPCGLVALRCKMIESLLQKAISSSGQSYSYSPQQVAQMLDIHAQNINVIDHKIMMVQLFWFAMILGSLVWNLKKVL